MPENDSQTTDRRSFNAIALVLGAAVLVGFSVLPRLAQTTSSRLVGKPAPHFALEVIHGGVGDRIDLSELRGRPVLLAFWASWCGPCQMEAPGLSRLYDRVRNRNALVIGINTNDQRTRGVEFAKKRGLSYPVVFDDGSDVADRYGVRALPTVVVVDKNGVVSAVRTGPADEASLEELLEVVM